MEEEREEYPATQRVMIALNDSKNESNRSETNKFGDTPVTQRKFMEQEREEYVAIKRVMITPNQSEAESSHGIIDQFGDALVIRRKMMEQERGDYVATKRVMTTLNDSEAESGHSGTNKNKRMTGPSRRSTIGCWTTKEDELLEAAVRRFNGKGWKKIAECIPGRTEIQCLHRWQKVLNPDLVKGSWSKEEDNKLSELVITIGIGKWSEIAKSLPGRIGKQCRERWHNHLNPDIKTTTWTNEEDLALIEAHKTHGNKWALLATILPGRSENAIKNHWNCSLKKKVMNLNASTSVNYDEQVHENEDKMNIDQSQENHAQQLGHNDNIDQEEKNNTESWDSDIHETRQSIGNLRIYPLCRSPIQEEIVENEGTITIQAIEEMLRAIRNKFRNALKNIKDIPSIISRNYRD